MYPALRWSLVTLYAWIGSVWGFVVLVAVADRATPRVYRDAAANLIMQPGFTTVFAGTALLLLGLALLQLVSLHVTPPTIAQVGRCSSLADYLTLPLLVKMTLVFFWVHFIVLVGAIMTHGFF